jgi:hypothetical protein
MPCAARWIVPVTLVALAGGTLPAAGQVKPGTSEAAALLAPLSPTTIYLRAGLIDTSGGSPPLGDVAGPGSAGKRFLVQLDGPMTEERRASLAAAGVAIGEYYPANAYVARLDKADAAAVGRLAFIRWFAPISESWKVDPEVGRPAQTPEFRALEAQGREALIVTLYRDERADAADAAILAVPGTRIMWSERVGGSQTLAVEAPAGSVLRLAAIGAVAYVEPAPEVQARNVDTRWIVQSNIQDQTPLYDRGLHGEGQVVGVLDDKLDVNHCSFKDTDPIGPDHRKIVAYNTQQGVGGHGTHVSGIAVGDGGDFGETRGVAYLGRLCYDDIPNFNESAVYTALSTHHDQTARVHTNSWGNDGTKAYDSLCRGFDALQYDNEESMVVLAVTNAGDLRNPENAKNLLAIGGSFDYPNQHQHCTGGVGPTTDGRRKPEVYAPGCDILSSQAGTQCGVVSFSGTSMATPAVAGTGLLVRQYFTEGFYPSGAPNESDGFTPTGTLVKAALVNSSVDMTGVNGYPTNLEGWGRVLADNALYFSGEARRLIVSDVRNADGLSTGQTVDLPVAVTGGGEQLRITLVWTEPPANAGASFASINDLDLEVIAVDGTVYKGNVFSGGISVPGGSKDDRNNVEQVHLNAPSPGQWTVRIVGAAVNEGTQGYSVVVSGEVDSGPAGLSISLASELPDFLDPGVGLDVEAAIDAGEDVLVPGSPTLHYRLDDGSFLTMPLADIGEGRYAASLPGAACEDAPQFYISAEGESGGLKTAPFNAPEQVFSYSVGHLEEAQVAAFSFESGLPEGWLVSGLWHISNTCSPGGQCDGGPFVYYGKDNGCTYGPGQSSGSLTGAAIQLPEIPPGGSITLTYCSSLQTEDLGGYDTATLFANGNPVDTAVESGSWQERAVDLSALAGQSVTLRWTFDTVDDQFNNFRGWHVDGVRISATSLVCEDGCYGDYNGDGVTDFFDFLAFTNSFNQGEDRADCDGAGGLDFFDFLCFQNEFLGGC